MYLLDFQGTSNQLNDTKDLQKVKEALSRLSKAEVRDILKYIEENVDGVPIKDHVKEKTSKSSIEDHPEWFAPVTIVKDNKNILYGGVNESCRTKESFFNRCIERRIENYYKKPEKGIFPMLKKHFISCQKSDEKREEVYNTFCEIVKGNKEKRKYFDRSETKVRMCTDKGKFVCKDWKEPKNPCRLNHSINPYKCREQRLLFSCSDSRISKWSLDHM